MGVIIPSWNFPHLKFSLQMARLIFPGCNGRLSPSLSKKCGFPRSKHFNQRPRDSVTWVKDKKVLWHLRTLSIWIERGWIVCSSTACSLRKPFWIGMPSSYHNMNTWIILVFPLTEILTLLNFTSRGDEWFHEVIPVPCGSLIAEVFGKDSAGFPPQKEAGFGMHNMHKMQGKSVKIFLV